jgi:hypothetical protein
LANNVINVPTGHLNLSPTLFHAYALQYLQCEQSFKTDARYSPVLYFLVCRSIELELKAKHLESKSRSEVKKQYGHNLTKSYDGLPDTDRKLDPLEYQQLARASDIYDMPNKGFEYVSVFDTVTGLKNFPDLGALERIASELIGE